jgi:hypothetical protein
MMIIIAEIAEVAEIAGEAEVAEEDRSIETNRGNEAKIAEMIGGATLVGDMVFRGEHNLRRGNRSDTQCAEAITDLLANHLHLRVELGPDTVTMNLKTNCITSTLSVQMSLEDDFGVLRKSLKLSKTKS